VKLTRRLVVSIVLLVVLLPAAVALWFLIVSDYLRAARN